MGRPARGEILNRRLRWEDDEITYEADLEHVRKLVEGIGLLADSNGLEKPAIKEAVEDVGDLHWNEELDPDDARLFRALAARANYLSQDRADVQYAAKEACRHMRLLHGPPGEIETVGSLLAPVSPALVDVHEGRVRDGHHRCVLRLRLGGMCPYSAIHVRGRRHRRRIGDEALELDAGDGGPLEWRGEYLALVKAVCEGLGIEALARDLVSSSMSTPALHVPSRIARGKLRHIERRVLWVQQAVRECRFALCRVAGKDKPADILTKPISLDEMREKLRGIGAIVHARGEPERRRWADYSLYWRGTSQKGRQEGSQAVPERPPVGENASPMGSSNVQWDSWSAWPEH